MRVETVAIRSIPTPKKPAAPGPKIRLIEIIDLHCHSIAAMATTMLLVGETAFSLLGGLLLLAGFRFDIPWVTWADAWFQVPVLVAGSLSGFYLAVRGTCWLYNRLVARIGGIIVQVLE